MEFFIYGLVFIFFSGTFTIPYIEFDLQILPAFIGYVLLLKPIRKYREVEKSFDEIYYLSIVMAIFTLIEFVSGVVQIDLMNKNQTVTQILQPITTLIVPLFVSYRIIWSIKRMEISHQVNLNTDILGQLWIYLAILFILVFFLNDAILLSIVSFASYGVKIVLVYNLAHTAKLYRKHEKGVLA